MYQIPNQKTPKYFVEPQQVFDAERQAHFDAQKKQAGGVAVLANKHANKNLALKIVAVKEEERKAVEALAALEGEREEEVRIFLSLIWIVDCIYVLRRIIFVSL